MPFHEVLPAQDLDSSVAEFILSQAEGLLQNDMGGLGLISLVGDGHRDQLPTLLDIAHYHRLTEELVLAEMGWRESDETLAGEAVLLVVLTQQAQSLHFGDISCNHLQHSSSNPRFTCLGRRRCRPTTSAGSSQH